MKQIDELKEKWPKLVTHPTVKDFLKNRTNKELFYKSIERSDINILNSLNEEYQRFHRKDKIIRYLVGLIKRYPIDYDKRIKKRKKRESLLLDKNINDNSDVGTTLKDMLENTASSPMELLEIKEVKQAVLMDINNPELFKAMKSLTRKQIEIIYFYYELGYTNKEIAKHYGQTEQNISYWHKKTLRQIKENLCKVGNEIEN